LCERRRRERERREREQRERERERVAKKSSVWRRVSVRVVFESHTPRQVAHSGGQILSPAPFLNERFQQQQGLTSTCMHAASLDLSFHFLV
jgi:hypothetical protein